MIEDTLVILKPDTLSRGLVGAVFDRLEKVGLKLVACKMTKATKEQLDQMYNTKNTEWVKNLGNKTLETFSEHDINPIDTLGTDDPYKIGLEVAKHLHDYLMMGPVVVMVWEGIKAVSIVRKVRGATAPFAADIGSILGDYSHDSQVKTATAGRSLRNLVHASGNLDEAKEEIAIWFGKNFEPMEYDRTDGMFF